MGDKLLLVGGGGHCKVVLESLMDANEYEDVGIIDLEERIGERILEIPVIGCDGDLPRLREQGYTHAFVSLGSVGDARHRQRLYQTIEDIGFDIPNIVDRTAAVSRYCRLDRGIYIGKQAAVNAGAELGKGVIVNTSAVVEHDCRVRAFVHVAPGSVLCGNVEVGEGAHIGARSVVKQRIGIGADSIIGMGSVVLNDVGDRMVAYGHPCREVKIR